VGFYIHRITALEKRSKPQIVSLSQPALKIAVIFPRLFSDFESLSELNAGECQATLR